MFMKLSQHSTAWWVCVAITCVFSASLLTVSIYPVYALFEVAVCHRNNCGKGGHQCGPCDGDDGLGENGWYQFEAGVTGYQHWVDGNVCRGRANTYHSVYIENFNGGGKEYDFRAKYKALFIKNSASINCAIQGQVPTVVVDFSVEDGDSYTNTYSQSRPYVLGALDVECWYQVQAVTEFSFLSIPDKAHGWDIQSIDPPIKAGTPGGFEACP